MSRQPNNINNHPYNFQSNSGMRSSLRGVESQTPKAGQQSSQSSIYSCFPVGQTWSDKLPGNSSFSDASNNNDYRGGQQAVTWIVEQPDPRHSTNFYGQTIGPRGDQQPVTWIVEQSSLEYENQSKSQPPQPQQQVTNVYAPNQNALTHQMQYEQSHQRSHPFSKSSYVTNNAFQPSTGVFSSSCNNGLFLNPYVPIALPPPPPPPPPAVSNVTYLPSRSRSPVGQSALPPFLHGQKRESDSKYQKRSREDAEHNKRPGKRRHESKSTRSQDKRPLRWKPPHGKQNESNESKNPVPRAQSKKLCPQNMGKDSLNGRASVQKPQISHQLQSCPEADANKSNISDQSVRMNKAVDANVAAISALSALETKWAAPVNKPLTRTQRRRHNRNKKNNLLHNVGSAPSGSNSLYDAVDLIGNWVNIESSENETSIAEAPKNVHHESFQHTEQLKQCDGHTTVNNVIDLTDDKIDFPPLSESHQNNTEIRQNVESDGCNSGISLYEMSTSQLKSYAAVLSRAIDDSKPPSADETPKNLPYQLLESDPPLDSGVPLNDEMDMSEDGHENEYKLKPSTIQIIENASNNKPENTKVNDTHSVERVDVNATGGSLLKLADTAANFDASSRLEEEKQRCRLRLEELRAKAKLANAKLRLAQKKRALGNDAPLSSQNVSSSEALCKIKNQKLLSTQSISDVTALRLIKQLVIDVSSHTEQEDKLRFVESVYQDTTDDDQSDVVTKRAKTPPLQEPRMPLPDSETRKETESLRQKLQLAKLRLEIKKKERALEVKMKQSLAKVAPQKQDKDVEPVIHGLPSIEPIHNSQQLAPFVIATNTEVEQPSKDSQLMKDEVIGMASDLADIKENKSVSKEQKISHIQELKRRQKELKQSNEVSSLRNLIQRQREILRSKGQELAESSTQLKSCVIEIKSKQQDLAASEKRIEEMHHRKLIMEGMVLRATDKLMTARTNLREKQVQEANARARRL